MVGRCGWRACREGTYSVLLEMRRKLAPLLFDDEDREGAAVRRSTVVAKARVSVAAEKKAATKLTAGGELPVHSFQCLLDHMSRRNG